MRKGSPVTRMSRRIRGTQRGAALLAFMLILIAGSAALLLSRLDAHAYAGARNVASQRVLLDAKQALIRYAMMYPDLTGIPGTGPGLLPCPDFDGDGAADNCGTTTADKVQLGRLPYRNLGTAPLRDSVGEHLWYAVSDNFKESLGALVTINSNGPEGRITVDAADDIVAVVIAPGTALGFQNGRPGNDADDYLEQPDALDDGVFRTSGNPFNDRLVTITRAELVAALEQNALGVLARGLEKYRARYGAYPWLSPFGDADFNAAEGTRAGRVPFHDDNRPFETTLGVDWSVTNGRVSVDNSATSTAHRTAMTAAIVTSAGTMTTGLTAQAKATCTWVTEDEASCLIEDDLYLSGVASSSSSPNAARELNLDDADKNFTNAGIKRGDVVINYSLPSGEELASGTGKEGETTLTSEGDLLLLRDITKDFPVRDVVERTSMAVVTAGGKSARFIVQKVEQRELTLLPLPGESLDPGDGVDFEYIVYKASKGIVDSTTGVPTRLKLRAIAGDSTFRLREKDTYRVLVSSRRFDERADTGTDIDQFIVYERNTNFCTQGVKVGDPVENMTYGGIGVITAVGCTFPYWFTYTALQGGTYPDIFQNENYRIHHTPVDRRSYAIEFAGNPVVPDATFADWTGDNAGKKRSVCIGYGNASLASENFCKAGASPVSLRNVPGNFVVITDTHTEDGIDEIVGRATLSSNNPTTGSLRVVDMDYYLVPDRAGFNLVKSEAELPAWFVDKEWYRSVYVAYSGGLAPDAFDEDGKSVPCGPAADIPCLSLRVVRADGEEEITGIEGLVAMAPGIALDGQDRSVDAFTEYFEEPHAEGQLVFRKARPDSSFNDQVRLLTD